MRKINKLLLLTYLLSVAYLTFSQNLKKQEITNVVTQIASLVKENYVFENRAQTISEGLLSELKHGKFNSIKTWQTLADSLTSTLQSLSNDKHMYVRNEPKTVKELIESESKITDESAIQTSEDPFYYSTGAVENNFGFSEVKILKQNIGYIRLSEINFSEKSLPTLYAAMQFISHTKALIIDLRDNGGGGSEVGAVLASYFLPRDITLLEFKNRTGDTSYSKTVTWLTEKKYDNPLYIIVNEKTGSAAEAFAFCLQNQKRATIVGKHSAGAANMNSWYTINDNLFVSVSTSAPTIPGTQKSWESTGVIPDFEVESGNEIETIFGILNK
jgi:hypothetical protein